MEVVKQTMTDITIDILKTMVALAVIILVLTKLSGNRDQVKVNQFYDIATNCIEAGNLPHSKEYVEFCYDQAEKASGIDAPRFGDSQ